MELEIIMRYRDSIIQRYGVNYINRFENAETQKYKVRYGVKEI